MTEPERMPTKRDKPGSQVLWEIQQLAQLLRDHGVRRYLEIGARHGDSFDYLMRHLAPGAHGTAVDLPGGKWGKDGTERHLFKRVTELERDGYRCRVILGDSTAQSTVDLVRRGAPYDAVLIDGDHRYAGVLMDWHNYGPLARIVAFHDVVGEGQGFDHAPTGVEVPRLWRELCQQFPGAQQFVAQGSRMGIGVIVRP